MRLIFNCISLILALNTSGQKVFVETKLNRVIYCGIDNPISVWVEGSNLKDLSYAVDVGEIISKNDSGNLVWRICTSNIFIAKLKISSKKKVIREITFLIKKLPAPRILVPGENHHSPISKISWQGIRADIIDFTFEGIYCKIVRYNIKILYNKTKDTTTLTNKGSFLNKENTTYFNKLTPGDTVIVYNVEVKVGCAAEVYMINEVFKRVIN